MSGAEYFTHLLLHLPGCGEIRSDNKLLLGPQIRMDLMAIYNNMYLKAKYPMCICFLSGQGRGWNSTNFFKGSIVIFAEYINYER